ncbi:MAG: zinc dependent phospholipase C family protein [Armatimonadota bacterium]
MGHFIIARKVISNIAAGGFTAPSELKELLRVPDNQRAYCGGAIGPDLVEAKSHYGSTADLVRRMFYQARADVAKAKDIKAYGIARTELAFAYGWVSHFIMDMNTHQLVNGMQGIGDAYGFTTQAQKLSHGVYEAQLCAYLRRTIWNPNDKYDVLIPYAFVASVVGVSEASVRQMSVVLKGKIALELVASGNCDLTTEKLATIWNRCVTTSLQEMAAYLAAPQTLKNWDMDVGHIRTDGFTEMRSMVIEINDGKLPIDWGKQYPVFWEAIRDLSTGDRRAKLMELLGKTAAIASAYRIELELSTGKGSYELKMPDNWEVPYYSVRLDIVLNGEGSFSFSAKTDQKYLIHGGTKTISGSGSLTPKGLLTIKGTMNREQNYIMAYAGSNPQDVRFVQIDKSTFELSGSVKFVRDDKGEIYRLEYVQSQFEGHFESAYSETILENKGNAASTKSWPCSGLFSPKGSGVRNIEVKK